MTGFFRRAWANPTTTFSTIVAVAALLSADLATAAPAAVIVALKVIGGIAGILAGAAARDSSVPGAVSAAAALPPKGSSS